MIIRHIKKKRGTRQNTARHHALLGALGALGGAAREPAKPAKPFKPAEVAAVATALARSTAPAPVPKPSAIARGELAARGGALPCAAGYSAARAVTRTRNARAHAHCGALPRGLER